MRKSGNIRITNTGTEQQDSIPSNESEIAKATECGLYGCTVLETESYVGSRLTDKDLLNAYYKGKSEHAFQIMEAIFKRGVKQGDSKLLIWLAENSLKRTINAEAEDSVFAAMSPEQRREEIKRLTKQIELRTNG